MATETTCRILRRLAGDNRGTMLIETAIVAPVLILMALGSYDVGRMVTRQMELQSGVAEAEAIVLAANAGASIDTDELKSILMNSLSLADSNVSVDKLYRCNADTALIANSGDCAEDAVISSYVRIRLQDKYVPLWTEFGVGKTFSYNVNRMVQLGTVTPA